MAWLSLIIALQTLPTLWAKDVWFPDEVRHALVTRSLIEHGHWLVLYLGDAFYADKPPVYFWLVAAIALVVQSTEPVVFMIAAALSGWFFVMAQTVLGRRLGFRPRVILLAGTVLLANWFFIERLHQPRMDLLFGAFIMLSHAGFYAAIQPERGHARGWTSFAFLMAACAVLTIGPVGAAFPIAALVVFALRARNGRVLLSATMLQGFMVFSAVLGLYLAGVIITEGPAFLRAIMIDQTWNRAVHAVHQSQPPYWYLPQAFLAFLPMSLMLLIVPWHEALSRSGLSRLWSPQPDEHSGAAYVWCALASNLIILSALDYKLLHFLVPLCGLSALIAAHHLVAMGRNRRVALASMVAAMLALAGIAVPFAPGWTLWPEFVRGSSWVAGCLLISATLVWIVRRRGQLVFATALCAGMSLTVLPFYLITIHGLNGVMAPRLMGQILSDRANRGQVAVQFHTHYFGIFDYHAGRTIAPVATYGALDALIRIQPCGVVAIRQGDLVAWPNRPANIRIVARHQLDYENYALALWGGPACD